MADEGKHTLIYDCNQISEFWHLLGAPYSYVVSLVSRNKYVPEVENRTWMRQHVFAENRREAWNKFWRAVQHLDYNVGFFVKHDVPLESLVLYVTVNPRNEKKAMKALTLKCVDAAFVAEYKSPFGYGRASPKLLHWLRSSVDGAAYKEYVTLDIDDPSLIAGVQQWLAEQQIEVTATVTTRGGAHILIRLLDLESAQKKALFTHYPQDAIAIDTDMNCPLPGTLQGGFKVVMQLGNP